MLSVSSSPDPITSRWLRPRSAALRLSQLGAGYARLPQWGRRTFPKPHPSLDSSRCFMSNQPVATFRVNLSEALHTQGHGAWRYDGEALRHFTQKDGLASQSIAVIYRDKREDLWLGGDGVFKFNGTSFVRIH